MRAIIFLSLALVLPSGVFAHDSMEQRMLILEQKVLNLERAGLRQSTGNLISVDQVSVGMPENSSPPGITVVDFVQAYVLQNWALSPYLLDQSRMDHIETTARLSYSSSGELKIYRITAGSGDRQFDESIKTAIIKSKRLPQPLHKDIEMSLIFNLKEMVKVKSRR